MLCLSGLANSCPNLHQELIQLGRMKWAKSYCPKRRYNIMTTNIAESVNAAILPARRLPITAAHEFLRGMCQRWFCSRLEAANKLQSSITAGAVEEINLMREEAEKCDVFPITDAAKYHVQHTELGDGIINVEARTCSCGLWQLDQFPCFHAFSYARYAKVRISSLCHEFYSKTFLQGAYGISINPVPGKEAWEISRVRVLPMGDQRQAGRPKEKRYRSHVESQRQKECSRCHEKGHTMRTCTNPPASSNGSTNSKRRRVMHCSRCHHAGHTVRSCKETMLDVDDIGDMSSHVHPNDPASGQNSQTPTFTSPL